MGRQPIIGLAELMSLYGSDVEPVGQQAVIINRPPADIKFERLGGTVKLCQIQDTLPYDDWAKIQPAILSWLTDYINQLPAGKITLGISVYGGKLASNQIMRMGYTFKQALRQGGRSIRLVPNAAPQLNSAQLIHNRLLDSHGLEIVVCCKRGKTILANTVNVQNIASYSLRDYDRPKRDARVGMLPPKLAQIMINLASGTTNEPITVLDPFCGTGVVLQEALLMGYQAYGTDIDPRMIDYSRQNLEWLKFHFNLAELTDPILEVKDTTMETWKAHFDIVVSEILLGPPLTKLPTPDKLQSIRKRCDDVLTKFLKNIAPQIPSNTHLCLAVPAWQESEGHFLRLPSLDHLSLLGYNQPSFVAQLESAGLIYARTNQRVARELLVITRK